MPAMHPAYLVFIRDMLPKLFPLLRPIDNQWHHEVLKRARAREAEHRVELRV